ncbi:glucosamine-6-phosphate isomerase [Paenibacillus baekrokdamisoli]|uniref:Glucosamine-6-phosphate isomerase n=1 Tax=Paenibacillus baekrokdamisoli TaxID=1712516 RepID=A0A3G9IZT7_9BACL|nr:glucosamine-6-phosphate deaminase [Paenibacillus baekrokdamisoli]MBB3072872.1 glucosamine-6-phosphate isomerase [Paenibacillus baekrokdamisoli]BBH24430.1 glucosamine-6-phosphate isomerase [Paenibacillus baekrokdamisoli]
MKINIAGNYEELSRMAAEHIIKAIHQKPNALLSLAGGSTPLGTFRHLIDASRENRVSFAQCRFISLDEWVGLGGEDEGSCRSTLDQHFFEPLNISENQIHFYDGRSSDLIEECDKMDLFIKEYGPIDLIVLGVGLNGHLGFNEPDCELDAYSHVVELDDVTRTVSVKYFSEQKNLNHGITLGMKHIMETKDVLLLADGDKKAEIVKATVLGEMNGHVPSSLLQGHNRVEVFLDERAASLLGNQIA